jgi:hypothetical protein
LRKALDGQKKKIPTAVVSATNILANKARLDMRDAMTSVFKKATPYTLNAFWVDKATENRLSATVEPKDMAGRGRCAWSWLKVEDQGGPRPMKAFEKALGPLTGARFVVPAGGQTMTRGLATQVISRLGAGTTEVGVGANMTERTRARLARQKKNARGQRSEYFIAHSNSRGRAVGDSGYPLAIYRLVGPGDVEPVLVLAPKAPEYASKIKFEALARASIAKNLDKVLNRELDKALRQRKP